MGGSMATAQNAQLQTTTLHATNAAMTDCSTTPVDDVADGDVPMTIGEVARAFGMTLRALRFYESKRLVAPTRRGAVRFYRRDDRERITLILTGRRLGFTLTEIRDLVNRSGGRNLHLSREKCVEQINLLERQKRGIDVAIAELRQIYSSFYKLLLEDAHSC
jgi:DNA-binding transcriptional MerR regulator